MMSSYSEHLVEIKQLKKNDRFFKISANNSALTILMEVIHEKLMKSISHTQKFSHLV